VSGYNVELDGNPGDEIDCQFWIGSATGFGSERYGAVGGSNIGAYNLGRSRIRCSGIDGSGCAATGAAFECSAGQRRTRRPGANAR